MVFPVREVANVASEPDVTSPGALGLFNLVIESNREKHGWTVAGILLAAAFFTESSLDFGFDPITINGILRQNHKELVVDADSLVDCVAEAVPGLQVFGRIPAADSFILEVRVEAVATRTRPACCSTIP